MLQQHITAEEIAEIVGLYGLHPVQIRASLNNAIVKAYKLDIEKHIGTYDKRGYFYIFSIEEKKTKKIKISQKYFKIFKNFFENEILEKSISQNIETEINFLLTEKFISLNINSISRKKIIFSYDDSRFVFLKNINFVYKGITRQEREFFREKKQSWFFIKNIKVDKNKLRDNYAFVKVDPFSSKIAEALLEDIIEKVKRKSKNIEIVILKLLRKNKKAILYINKPMPAMFIRYLDYYLYERIMWRIELAK